MLDITRSFTIYRFWCHYGEFGWRVLTPDTRPGPLNPGLLVFQQMLGGA